MRRIHHTFLCLLALGLGIVLSGCVQTGPVGKWVRDSNDARIFEGKTLLDDHTYYYYGNVVTPEAIIAIDNKFTLKTEVWSRVEVTQKMLDDWMYWIHTRANILCPYSGGRIVTADGEKVGLWYSKKLISVVKTLEPGIIQVYPPYSLPGSDCDRQTRMDKR